MLHAHLYIAEILSKKFLNKGIEYEDIYQVASLGLIFAIERFDVSKGFEFSSFATPTIIGEIKKYFRDKGWSIRVPRRIQELSKKVNTAKSYLQQELHRVHGSQLLRKPIIEVSLDDKPHVVLTFKHLALIHQVDKRLPVERELDA